MEKGREREKEKRRREKSSFRVLKNIWILSPKCH